MPDGAAKPPMTPISESPSSSGVGTSLLAVYAGALDGIEAVRMATGSRHSALERPRDRHGKGLKGTPEEKDAAAMHAALRGAEAIAVRQLERAMRAHPLGPWVKRTVGIGEKQAARLFAAIGDPAARENPDKLKQYCGHGDPARSRRCKENVTYYTDPEGKTVVSLPFNPEAKKRLHLLAVQCTIFNGEPDKHGKPRPRSPYRDVYDRERAKWADRDTSDGHKDAHALRVVGQAILVDLWREARAHTPYDTRMTLAPLAPNSEREAA